MHIKACHCISKIANAYQSSPMHILWKGLAYALHLMFSVHLQISIHVEVSIVLSVEPLLLVLDAFGKQHSAAEMAHF
jgi:hypothetical protein